MSERPQPAPRSGEIQPLPEYLQFKEGQTGIQVRLLKDGPALSPNNNVGEVKPEDLKSFNTDTYNKLNKRSTDERHDYWRGKEGDFNKHKREWMDDIVGKVSGGKDYFEKTDDGKRWSQLFSNLGITTSNFTSQEAEGLYNKYFTGDKRESNLLAFSQDVIKVFTKEDGTVNYQALKTNIDGILWLSNIFGKKSSQIISQMIDGEVKVKDERLKEAFIVTANQKEEVINAQGQKEQRTRGDRLTEDYEIPLLEFISEEKYNPQAKQTQPPQPQPNPNPDNPPDPNQPSKPKPETITPLVSAVENLRAAHRFIDVVRDKTRYKNPPDGFGRYRHDLGFDVTNNIENGWFGLVSFTDVFNDRYKMPLALYLLNGNHAVTILKPPYQENGQWKIKVYNPFYEGEQYVNLTRYDELNRRFAGDITAIYANLGIYLNQPAFQQFGAGDYDLSISGRQDLKKYAEFLYKEKMAALQQDGKNCVPFASFMGAMLNALKPGQTEFKQAGLRQFFEDFGIKIRTYEEIMGTAA